MVDDEEEDEVQRHNIEDEYMEDWSVLAVAPVQEEDEVQRHNIEDWSALAVAPVQEDGGYNVDQDAADVAVEQEVSDPCLEAVEGAIWYLETITAVVQTDKKFEVMTGMFLPLLLGPHVNGCCKRPKLKKKMLLILSKTSILRLMLNMFVRRLRLWVLFQICR